MLLKRYTELTQRLVSTPAAGAWFKSRERMLVRERTFALLGVNGGDVKDRSDPDQAAAGPKPAPIDRGERLTRAGGSSIQANAKSGTS